MNKQSITSLIAAAALAGTFGLAQAQGSATAVPGTTNNQLSSGANHDASGAHGSTQSMDGKKDKMKSAGKSGTTMNSNTNPRGTGTVENNGTQATPGGTGAAGSMTSGGTSGSSSSSSGTTGRSDAGTMNSNTNPRGTGTVENNSNQATTGGTGAVKK